MKTPIASLGALMLASTFIASPTEAASLLSCNVADVQITRIDQYSDNTANAVLSTVASGITLSAADCAGAYSGNDGYYPQLNLGYANDGLLNGGTQVRSGETLFPGGAFISADYPLYDLDNDGRVNDPGWIMLGKFEDVGGSNWVFLPSTVGGLTGIVLDSFFTASITGAGTGTWALTPDATVAQRTAAVLGKNYFDQFALVFKAADAFAVYDFTAAQFGVTDPSAESPAMHWYGTYDLSNTLRAGGSDGLKNPAGLSHITVWARDPADGINTVPEPGTLGLLGIAALGMLTGRRRRTA